MASLPRCRVVVAVVAALVAALAGAGASHDAARATPRENQPVSTLRIIVTGLKSNRGQVRVAVFDAPERWLKGAAFAKVLEIQDRRSEWVVTAVPHGDYGIAAFHDENANGKNDRNLLGLPAEPYGFSNNRRARFGPPSWAQVKFALASPSAQIIIEVK